MEPAAGQSGIYDDAPGVIGVTRAELPVLPDAALTDSAAGFIDPRGWFVDPALPLEIEIGCGKGSFLVEQSPRSPGVNFLGIEYEREYYAYAADRLRRRAVRNVRMLCADATEFLRWRCPANVAGVIHLYYSDPWPKAKHHKNRVVQDRFLADAWRVLTDGGEVRVVTDHSELWAWCEGFFARWTAAGREGIPTEVLRACGPGTPDDAAGLFVRDAFTPPAWVGDGGVVGTNYERKFTGEGKRPHAAVLRVRKGGAQTRSAAKTAHES